MPLLHPHLENRVWFNIDNDLFYWVQSDVAYCGDSLECGQRSAWTAEEIDRETRPDDALGFLIEV